MTPTWNWCDGLDVGVDCEWSTQLNYVTRVSTGNQGTRGRRRLSLIQRHDVQIRERWIVFMNYGTLFHLTNNVRDVLLLKLKDAKVFQDHPAFYWSRRFFAVSMRSRQCTLSWSNLIQFVLTHCIYPYIYALISQVVLCLKICLMHVRFPACKRKL